MDAEMNKQNNVKRPKKLSRAKKTIEKMMSAKALHTEPPRRKKNKPQQRRATSWRAAEAFSLGLKHKHDPERNKINHTEHHSYIQPENMQEHT